MLDENGGANLYEMVNNNLIDAFDFWGLFLYAFDGTNNDKDRDQCDNPDALNAPSNVAIMYELYTEEKYYKNSVGTRTDIRTGKLFGNGIGERVDDLYNQFLDNYKKDPMHPVDVIGFGRGAVSARIFVNRIRKSHPDACISFLGLFDTMVQIGYSGGDGGYDVDIPDFVNFTAHAIAQNEYRDLFPLNSIHDSYSRYHSYCPSIMQAAVEHGRGSWLPLPGLTDMRSSFSPCRECDGGLNLTVPVQG